MRPMSDLQKCQHYRSIAKKRAEAYCGSLRDSSLPHRKRHALNMDLQQEYAIFFSSLPAEDRELFDHMYAKEIDRIEKSKLAEASIVEQPDRFSARFWVALLLCGSFVVVIFAIV